MGTPGSSAKILSVQESASSAPAKAPTTALMVSSPSRQRFLHLPASVLADGAGDQTQEVVAAQGHDAGATTPHHRQRENASARKWRHVPPAARRLVWQAMRHPAVSGDN